MMARNGLKSVSGHVIGKTFGTISTWSSTNFFRFQAINHQNNSVEAHSPKLATATTTRMMDVFMSMDLWMGKLTSKAGQNRKSPAIVNLNQSSYQDL